MQGGESRNTSKQVKLLAWVSLGRAKEGHRHGALSACIPAVLLNRIWIRTFSKLTFSAIPPHALHTASCCFAHASHVQAPKVSAEFSVFAALHTCLSCAHLCTAGPKRVG